MAFRPFRGCQQWESPSASQHRAQWWIKGESELLCPNFEDWWHNALIPILKGIGCIASIPWNHSGIEVEQWRCSLFMLSDRSGLWWWRRRRRKTRGPRCNPSLSLDAISPLFGRNWGDVYARVSVYGLVSTIPGKARADKETPVVLQFSGVRFVWRGEMKNRILGNRETLFSVCVRWMGWEDVQIKWIIVLLIFKHAHQCHPFSCWIRVVKWFHPKKITEWEWHACNFEIFIVLYTTTNWNFFAIMKLKYVFGVPPGLVYPSLRTAGEYWSQCCYYNHYCNKWP